MHSKKQISGTTNHINIAKTKVAWYRPVIGRIDIKRTMYGTGSLTDSHKTSSLTNFL